MYDSKRKVTKIICHQGIQLGSQVKTSVSTEGDKVEMEMWPMGIHVEGVDPRTKNKFSECVTYNMIHSFSVEPVNNK